MPRPTVRYFTCKASALIDSGRHEAILFEITTCLSRFDRGWLLCNICIEEFNEGVINSMKLNRTLC